jgi:LPS sulfotransferase NodH
MQSPHLVLEQLGDIGRHQQEIEGLFAGNVAWTGTDGVIDRPLVVLAFTNRCGSNYLAELMRSTGLVAGLGEALNAEAVANRCDKWGVTSFPGYFQTLAERHKVPFGVKASWDQLLMLLRWGIPRMHSGLQVIHIYRRDIIGQAISRDIAWQTGKWTSLTKVEEDVTPTYDAFRVSEQIASIQREEGLFPLIFDAFQLNVTHVAYEDLVDRPAAVVRRTMRKIGLPCPDWTPEKTRIEKQADSVNEAFRDAYREILREHCSRPE